MYSDAFYVAIDNNKDDGILGGACARSLSPPASVACPLRWAFLLSIQALGTRARLALTCTARQRKSLKPGLPQKPPNNPPKTRLIGAGGGVWGSHARRGATKESLNVRPSQIPVSSGQVAAYGDPTHAAAPMVPTSVVMRQLKASRGVWGSLVGVLMFRVGGDAAAQGEQGGLGLT